MWEQGSLFETEIAPVGEKIQEEDSFKAEKLKKETLELNLKTTKIKNISLASPEKKHIFNFSSLPSHITPEKILEGLNPAQKEAVIHRDGPALILAGAGSGKTRVVTRRLAYLVYKYKVSPYQILAVTFTNKAAGEMKERFCSFLGKDYPGLWIMTFHAACLRILRADISPLGYKNDFIVYDEKDRERLIKQILKELNIDSKRYSPRAIQSEISNAKGELMDPDYYQKIVETPFEEIVAKVYSRYQKKLFQANALDFDDLIFLTVQLFEKHPQVLEKYQNRFRYIMIDEYQDTNYSQHKFSLLLAQKHKNLFVVGDDDQLIYEWRGAEIENILHFEEEFPETEVKIVNMLTNYRSTDDILEVANSVIQNNSGRKKSEPLEGVKGKGERVKIIRALDDRMEAFIVVHKIKELTSTENYNLKDIVIFYRSHVQSRLFEEELLRKNIPYRIFRGTSFYERMEVKDILAYLKLITNPHDVISLSRIINVPGRGIGKSTQEKLVKLSEKEGVSVAELLLNLKKYNLPFSLSARKKLEEFSSLLEELIKKAKSSSIQETLEFIIKKIDYYKYLQIHYPENYEERIANVEELFSTIADFEENDSIEDKSLPAFLNHLSLLTDVDADKKKADAVNLMTIHCSKGLEFPVVFVTGLEEGTFPSFPSLDKYHKIEEERRLCYVAITRAQEKLFLTYAKTRKKFGKTLKLKKSRFLCEIPNRLVDKLEF